LDEKILRLKELQRIGLALRALEAERQQGPIRLAALEEVFNATSATVGAVKHRYDALREESAKVEVEQKDLQDRLAKFQAQLMEVKNSKEYSAVLKEIDSAKSEISKRDEDLLAKMQEMESLQKDLPDAEASLKAETLNYERERSVILGEMESFEARRLALEAERRRDEAGLPRDVVATFYRVAEARQGIAMARVVEAVCSACNVRLRPQIFSEVRRGDLLLTCDSCRRYLYYEPDPPGETAEPKA